MRTPLAIVLAMLAGSALADPNPTTFHRSGTATFKCACILATTGCSSRIADALAGSQRHTWSYDGSVNQDVTLDISELCWRKRNVDDMGEGVCCNTGSYTNDAGFFWGEVSRIEK